MRKIKQYTNVVGSGLPLTTEIATVDGFKLLLDVHVNDFVYNSDGTTGIVQFESIVNNQPFVEVMFDTGDKLTCSANQNFIITDRETNRRNIKVPIASLIDQCLIYCDKCRFIVSNTKPVQYRNTAINLFEVDFSSPLLDRCLYAPVTTRFDIVDRIVNNYGVVLKRSQTYITIPNINQSIVSGIKQLVCSLGFKPRVVETFSDTTNIIFNISQSENEHSRGIVSINRVENSVGKIIVVDNEDSTLLVTRNYIPVCSGSSDG